ncbi:haloacid dehalogenase type II [Streptomyces silvisoli]|uniref:Haloacid dehalogenase type II n=1 Tax=Streptomyces silvisoli TaxID=3034235 RepID=A0ABT5ZD53_9ACTN|nr:haloacid dehalogenase type II [Streptomyces silvisoli]MDF3287763.1 haloacid dehalogenase type II [Streptomyces silvisoli]
MTGPRLVLFDVNETLSDMSALGARFEEIGAPAHLLPTWFAGVLRDGFALTAAGAYADFLDVAQAGLRGLLADLPGWHGDLDSAVAYVLDGLNHLAVHPDVAEGVRVLRDAGLRLATLTNGSTAATERLLDGAELRDCFEALLDVSAPAAWKPAAAAYQYATETLGTAPEETVLVAVHPWDIDGARRAGLKAAWLQRKASGYPAVMKAADYTATDLPQLALALAQDR